MPEEERTAVRTYVPAYQKEQWREHADAMGVSLSEFVRTMVQAGRSEFEVPDLPDPDPAQSGDADPRGNALETRILDALSEEDRSWDELVEALTDGVEDRVEEALDDLQRENRVVYDGRAGGYTLVDE